MESELNLVYQFLEKVRKSRFHLNVGKRSYNFFYNRDYLHRKSDLWGLSKALYTLIPSIKGTEPLSLAEYHIPLFLQVKNLLSELGVKEGSVKSRALGGSLR